MSRRKQAKPRAVFKSADVEEEELANMGSDDLMPQTYEDAGEDLSVPPTVTGSRVQVIGDGDCLDDDSDSDTMGTDPNSLMSCYSEETGDDEERHDSMSPSSCETGPDGHDGEISFTIGPTESTPYGCNFCEKAYPRLSFLKRHEQSHSDQMPFKCDFCQRLFKHKRSRDRHVKLHTGDKKYRCPSCSSAFSRSDHLKIHLKTHDHQKPYQCVACNRGYNTAAALTSHMQNHKKGDNSSSSSHTQSPLGQSFRCLQCPQSFPTGEELQSHVQQSHAAPQTPNPSSNPPTPTPPPPPPPVTTSTISSPNTSQKSPSPLITSRLLTLPGLPLPHTLTFPLPLTTPTQLTCIYCAKDNFTSIESLQLHVQALHGPLTSATPTNVNGNGNGMTPSPSDCSLPCTLCTMKFPSLPSLHKHLVSSHSLSFYLNNNNNNFCCGVAFPSSSAYGEHLLLFHSKSPNSSTSSASPPPQSAPTDLSKKKKKKATPPVNANVNMNTLLCNQCNAGFSDFESFRAHLKQHLLEPNSGTNQLGRLLFSCDQCDSEFGTEEQLENHVMVHYLSTSMEYGCSSCLKVFGKPDELQKHLLDIHAHHLYRCSLCKEVFDSKVSIQVHFAVKHSNECKLFRCSGCSGVFRSEIEFQLHVRLLHLQRPNCASTPTNNPHSKPVYRCLLCSATFPTEMDLSFHHATHQKQFHCKLCDESFHVEFLLDKHMNLHNLQQQQQSTTPTNSESPNQKKRKTHCDICDKAFSNDFDLTTHRKHAHHIDESCGGGGDKKPKPSRVLSLNCAYCNNVSKSRSELENHMKTHQIVGKNKCNICDEVCPTPTLLAEHKLTHCKVIAGNKCTQCKEEIRTRGDYFHHVKVHNGTGGSGSFPAACVVCRQTMTTDVELQLHSRFHTEHTTPHPQTTPPSIKREREQQQPNNPSTKSYQCIKCQSTFSSEQEIQTHVTLTHLHDSNSNNSCHLCPRPTPFDSPLKLQVHLIEHTFEGISFSCYICSAVFTSANGLQSHMVDSHGLQSRPYDCHLCHLKFWFRAEMDNHLVGGHGKGGTGAGDRDNGRKKKSGKRKQQQQGTGGGGKKRKFFYRDDSEEEGEVEEGDDGRDNDDNGGDDVDNLGVVSRNGKNMVEVG